MGARHGSQQDCTTISLENGIYISFGAIGHAAGNYWDQPGKPTCIRDTGNRYLYYSTCQLVDAVTFATNWEDLSTSYEDCSYYKDPAGVHRGLAHAPPEPSDTIFTLPTGYRWHLPCRSNDTANGTTCAVIITGNGT